MAEKAPATTDVQSNGDSNGTASTMQSAPPVSFERKQEWFHGAKQKPSRAEVNETMSALTNLIHASNKPLPHRYGDGKQRRSIYDETYNGTWEDVKSLMKQGHLKESYKTVSTVAKHKKHGGYTDDKTYIMEHVIRLSAHLPASSLNRLKLTAQQVDQLWNTLQHPPLSLVGTEYIYRQPDGGNNNLLMPDLGRAGTPYTRTVKPMTLMPSSKPDAGLVFDSIMCRRSYREHPNKVSSMLFYVASIIIHDLFQTNRRNRNISDTSSYLDLSPLYGNNAEEQKKMRTWKDGKLKPDCYSEKRLLAFPPGVSTIMIMFNRFHNYVVEQLAGINEGGRFDIELDFRIRDKEAASKAAIDKRDEDLFQTGRLVTCGLYINMILSDYLRTIVNLNRTDSTWTLDPRFDPSKIYDPTNTPQGTGNQVAVEFNLIYRWHSAISRRDEIWIEDFYKELFGDGYDGLEMPIPEFLSGIGKWERNLPEDPGERTFSGLTRGPDGKFDDGDLVKLLTESIEDQAGAFGARNIPAIMRSIEILGIEQSRKWQVASLNEFRSFFGLEPHKTFESINRNPEVADTLRQLYDHPDFVELYPGLVAEEEKVPMKPGVGIAPTFTVSRAILSDAVVLVRGDRHYTIDYTPTNLTNWGFQEVTSDHNVNHGCVFYKLFLRCFPNHFRWNSIYAMYPLTIPSETRKIMKDLGRYDLFDFNRPKFEKPRIPVLSYEAVKKVLNDKTTFNVMWDGFTWIYGKEFMLSGDTDRHSSMRNFVGGCIFGEQAWQKEVKEFYEEVCTRLLKEKRYKVPGPGARAGECYQIDIIRDFTNLAHANFAGTVFGLPLKTKDNPRDFFTEQELYLVLTLMFVCIFFDVDPSKSFPLRHGVRQIVQQFGKLVELEVKAIRSPIAGILAGKYFKRRNTTPLQSYGIKMIKRLLEGGSTAEDVTWSYILPTAGASCANQAQIFAQVVDFFLRPENAQYLTHIQELATQTTPESDELIKRYALEATRLAGTFGLYRKVNCPQPNNATANEPATVSLADGPSRILTLEHGDKVFVSFISASRDPSVFPEPEEVRLDRPMDSYIQYGAGAHKCLGTDINLVSLPTMLRFVGRLRGLRRAPGIQGNLKAVEKEGGFKVYMREDWSGYWPFPTTMKVRFDGVVGWDE